MVLGRRPWPAPVLFSLALLLGCVDIINPLVDGHTTEGAGEEDDTDGDGNVAIELDIFGTSATHMVPLHLMDRWLGTLYMVRACSLDCRDSQPPELVADDLLTLNDAIGYVKATNNGYNRVGDEFGTSVALADNGTALAIGVWRDDSAERSTMK